MVKRYQAIGAFGLAVAGAVFWASNTDDAPPAENPNICKFDKGTDTLVIVDKKTGALNGILHDALELNDGVVRGPGEILDAGKDIGLRKGMVFTFNSHKGVCEISHGNALWGEGLSAPVEPNTKFELKFTAG